MMPDPASLMEIGLVGLFIAAFLAGSVLPFPSEVVVVGLLSQGAAPVGVWLAATFGNVLGAVTVYAMGRGGVAGYRRWRQRPPDPKTRTQAVGWIQRWGPWALLLSWMPVIGDPIVLGAGLAGVKPVPVIAFVTVGKGGRYLVLTALTLELV